MLQKHKIAHLLRNLEFVIKRSRNKCAMTVLNIQSLVFFGDGFIGCQEVRKARGQAGLEDRKVRRYEGRLFTVKSLFSNCRRLPSYSDITSSCKTQVSGAAATLHQRKEGIDLLIPSLEGRGSEGVGENQPLPQPSRLGKGAKPTYSQNMISTLTLSRKRRGQSTSRFTLHTSLKKQVAFTLAEVLITLGIIGVVAALTMPSLIANHTKSVVEARLEKFYSSMNQAIRMAELDYGPRETWFEDNNDPALQEAWIKKYIIPYMNVVKTDTIRVRGADFFTIYFSDGSAVSIANSNGRDWYFFPGDPERCVSSSPSRHYKDYIGRCAFAFYYNPVPKSTGDGFVQWNFEPYMAAWDGEENSLKNHSTFGCNENSGWPAFCTRWIQYNGWKIPKDYPFRVKY